MYRLSVEQYHRMMEAGVLKSGDQVELLEGFLVATRKRSPPNATTVTLIRTELLARLPTEWLLRPQLPITTEDSEPEPAAAVVLGPPCRYLTVHPAPADVALVVEVVDNTTESDCCDKKRIYGRAGIPIYWLVNLRETWIEVYTQPRGGKNPAYRQRRDYPREETIPLVLAGQNVASIPVTEILPLIPRPESQP